MKGIKLYIFHYTVGTINVFQSYVPKMNILNLVMLFSEPLSIQSIVSDWLCIKYICTFFHIRLKSHCAQAQHYKKLKQL